MRWPILRTLLHKEALRHVANRGGLALVLLLLVAALLLSVFGGNGPGGLTPGVRLCYVDYHPDGPLIDHLRENVPPDLRPHVKFRPLAQAHTNARGTILYPQGTGAIQLRPATGGGYKVWFWHPGTDPSTLAPYEVWFWRETLRFTQARRGGPREAGVVLAEAETQHSSLTGAVQLYHWGNLAAAALAAAWTTLAALLFRRCGWQ
jgi:hypothetical protein